MMYDKAFLKALFDEMQPSYERVSDITAFGFNRRWRKQLIERMSLHEGMQVADLMAGGGETWAYILARIGLGGHLTAVDFSRAMIQRANQRKSQTGAYHVIICEEDVFANSIASNSLDAVICVYGVKTLSPVQQQCLIHEVHRMLKEDGVLGLVEVSVPPFKLMRWLYLFYIMHIVPLVGRLLLGNPENYRMLGRYMLQFDDCRMLEAGLRESGFEAHYHAFFFGCATAIVGRKNQVVEDGTGTVK